LYKTKKDYKICRRQLLFKKIRSITTFREKVE
jgi:hypothetical protein